MFNSLSEKWNSLLGSPSLRILITSGQAQLIKGKVISSKPRAISQLLAEHDCDEAWIHYYSPHHTRSFAFSKNIPTNLHQQIRNIILD